MFNFSYPNGGIKHLKAYLCAGSLRHQDVDIPDGGAGSAALPRGRPSEAGQACRTSQTHLHHQGMDIRAQPHTEGA